MKPIFTFLILYLITLKSSGQCLDEMFKGDYKSDSIYTEKFCECVSTVTANEDIKNGKPKLFLSGGIAPILVHNQKKQEDKYGFEYYEFGCNMISEDCIRKYSKVIFEYFDKKYGLVWRLKVRKDTLFLN
jgi:hypothetical protein